MTGADVKINEDWFRVDSLAASDYHIGSTLSSTEPYRLLQISGRFRVFQDPLMEVAYFRLPPSQRGYPKNGSPNMQSDVEMLNG